MLRPCFLLVSRCFANRHFSQLDFCRLAKAQNRLGSDDPANKDFYSMNHCLFNSPKDVSRYDKLYRASDAIKSFVL